MEGQPQNNFESVEGEPAFEYIFFTYKDHMNPKKNGESIWADSNEEAFEKFYAREGREYGSESTDGYSRVEHK